MSLRFVPRRRLAGSLRFGCRDGRRVRVRMPAAVAGRAVLGRADVVAPRFAASFDADGGASSIDTRRCGGVPRGEERSLFARPTATAGSKEARRAVPARATSLCFPAPSFVFGLSHRVPPS